MVRRGCRGEYAESPAAHTGVDTHTLVWSASTYWLSTRTAGRVEKMRTHLKDDEAREGLALAYSGFRPRLAIHHSSEHCKVLEERVRKTWNPLP